MMYGPSIAVSYTVYPQAIEIPPDPDIVKAPVDTTICPLIVLDVPSGNVFGVKLEKPPFSVNAESMLPMLRIGPARHSIGL